MVLGGDCRNRSTLDGDLSRSLDQEDYGVGRTQKQSQQSRLVFRLLTIPERMQDDEHFADLTCMVEDRIELILAPSIVAGLRGVPALAEGLALLVRLRRPSSLEGIDPSVIVRID